MAVVTLERSQTISFQTTVERAPVHRSERTVFEPNFGPEDMHAIHAIAYIMNGIFGVALIMYGTITLFAWLGS